jgi:hypothetical protein
MFHFEVENLVSKKDDGCEPNHPNRRNSWKYRTRAEKHIDLHEPMEKRRCEHSNPVTNARCKRESSKQLPLCWQHTISDMKLSIKKTKYGLGLFACDIDKGPHEIVFRQNKNVALYARTNGSQCTSFERRKNCSVSELKEICKANNKQSRGMKKDMLDRCVKRKENFKKWDGPTDLPIGVKGSGKLFTKQDMLKRYGCGTNVYAVEIDDDKVIDTALQRSIGSYANQSDSANTISHWDGNTNTLWLKAIKNIKNGEEITWDYGDDYKFKDYKPLSVKSYHTRRPEKSWKCKTKRKSPKRKGPVTSRRDDESTYSS